MSQRTVPGAHGTDSTTRRHKIAVDETYSAHQSEHHETEKYTQEQLEAVTNIRSCKNYYEILGVPTECTDEDLRKSYKRLALKFHPDKNHAPGATEAFKAIGNAFAVLSNPEKRRRYDEFGSEEENVPVVSRGHYYSGSGGAYYEFNYTRGFEGDISPEELFNMFFNGAGSFRTVNPGGRSYRMRPTHEHHHHNAQPNDNESGYSYLFQLTPIIILLVVSLFTAFVANDSNYSLRSTQKFTIPRQTANLKIAYYVKADFSTSFKGSLRRLEQQVEEDHINYLKSSCLQEKSYRDSVLWHARSYGDKQLYEETLNRKLPSCDALQKIYG